MIHIPYDPYLLPGTWYKDNQGNTWLCCPNGHIGNLNDHDINENGVVKPSVQCPESGCNFHAMVILDA